MTRQATWLTAAAATLLAACTAAPTSPDSSPDSSPATNTASVGPASVLDSVTGTVTYRERVALPPTAVVRVQLQDASLQDVAAVILDSVTIRPQGRQVPLAFTLRYDPARIQEGGIYVVQARILDASGRLLFLNDEAYPVLTNGKPKRVDMVLRRVQ
ncbi:YbaY family lipoprotein [Hymenobacter weizhouensis]|uniref:YbaY family lipoprotein n=1 Tax=Hymenobacter sp. YIM 151500-1 TaxID=2987689 RepID=UPI0022266E4F|nr:YbaY family lipoprotein [Hymenobacter sp. YIM 151500-1]UYZ63486.1 YbaY family lipoprotein [Hymenobacter sp. YIM 151500-1]